MVKLSIQSENVEYGGVYTELSALNQLIEIFQKSDDVEIDIKYKVRGQAVECSSSINN